MRKQRILSEQALAEKAMLKRTMVRPARQRRRLLFERLSERRVLAAITGEVFEDVDFSLRRESGEAALEGRVLYLDSNQNASLDDGEPLAISDSAGQFSFPSLSDGTYLVRIFNGTSSQQQTFPIQATVEGPGLQIPGGNEALTLGSSTGLVTNTSVHVGDTTTGQSTQIDVADQLVDITAMPDGTLLGIGTDSGTQGVWLVEPSTQVVRPSGFISGTSPVPDNGVTWSQIEIDANAKGFLLGQTSSDAILRSIDASNTSVGIQVTASAVLPAETQLLSSDSGPRSVLAWAGQGGLELSLWSNGGSQIGMDTVTIAGADQLVDFDDEHGLLAIRHDDGDVSVLDVDGNFATLHTFSDLGDNLLIDGERELLLAFSPVDTALHVVDLRDGSTLTKLAVNISSIGSVSSLAFADATDSLVVLGSSGVMKLSLRAPGAHVVEVTGDETPDLIRFGLNIQGANEAPAYDDLPSFTTPEDTVLLANAPAATATAVDADGDSFIMLQTSNTSRGVSITTFSGGLQYEPEDNFSGVDSFTVILHDGRDASNGDLISITVEPVIDLPIVVEPIEPLPENAEPGSILGPIIINDPDFPDISFPMVIDDERFNLVDGNLVYVGGGINFEEERKIELVISIVDEELTELFQYFITVRIGDVNEPITDLNEKFGESAVSENVEGAGVATIDVEDEDINDQHTLTIDDGRFVFRGYDLYLADGVALDFEEAQSITVNITATDSAGHLFTKEFFILVLDEAEPPETISLAGDSVVEFVPGDVVGPVIVDGVEVGSGYSVSVNDSRFEIVDSTLKLADNQTVELATQSEIELTITVQDVGEEFDSVSEVFIISVLANATPFHNDDNPYDVNRSGTVTAADALAIINYLNTFGPGPVGSGNASYGYDVNSDEWVTALDALLVLNYLNLPDNGGTVGGEGSEDGQEGAEGEQPAESESPSNTAGFDSAGELTAPLNQEVFDGEISIQISRSNRSPVASTDQRPKIAASAISLDADDSSDESGDYAEAVDDVLRSFSEENA